MEGFNEKTYEKTCCFIIYFQSPVHIVHIDQVLRCGYFFSKIWWPFKFNVHFLHSPPLLRESLWKELPILVLIFKCSIIMCTLTKFSNLKLFSKKNGGCFKILRIYFSFPQLSATFVIKLKKRPIISLTYLKLRL